MIMEALIFVTVHPYFYPSATGFTHPSDGWTGHKAMTGTDSQGL